MQEEDAQPLTEPVIAPVKQRKWTIEEKDMPGTRFDKGCVVLILYRVYALTAFQIFGQHDVFP